MNLTSSSSLTYTYLLESHELECVHQEAAGPRLADTAQALEPGLGGLECDGDANSSPGIRNILRTGGGEVALKNRSMLRPSAKKAPTKRSLHRSEASKSVKFR